jgi:hypothetical protein
MDTWLFIKLLAMGAPPIVLIYLVFEGVLWVERQDKHKPDQETQLQLKRYQRLATVFACLFCVIALFFPKPTKAGTVDLSHDNNRGGGSPTALVVAGSPIQQVNSLVIADTTGYYELYLVGTSAKLGNVSVSAYAGVEGMKGVSAKPRGMAIASYSVGNFSASTVVEFAGNTGNFNKQALSYTVDTVTYSVVMHSVAGSGVRIDLKAGGVTPYFQLLTHRTTVGVVTSF